ncbi:hypothetical protein NYE67_10905 [Solibacillus sp. FSL W8-0474]|uniref:hypothetical protein n=1 Tax=Solibacillus sp. FSL W8-0474 TaxID=2975336 RepID=UPI0030F6CA74
MKTQKQWLTEALHSMEKHLLNGNDHMAPLNPYYHFEYTDEQRDEADFHTHMVCAYAGAYRTYSNDDQLFHDYELLVEVLKEEKLEHIAFGLSCYLHEASGYLEEMF